MTTSVILIRLGVVIVILGLVVLMSWATTIDDKDSNDE